MVRWLTRLLAVLLLSGALLLPANVHAQQPNPADTSGQTERDPHVFAWVLAILTTLIVLLIVCMPSRKA
jgi:hypothetical protein